MQCPHLTPELTGAERSTFCSWVEGFGLGGGGRRKDAKPRAACLCSRGSSWTGRGSFVSCVAPTFSATGAPRMQRARKRLPSPLPSTRYGWGTGTSWLAGRPSLLSTVHVGQLSKPCQIAFPHPLRCHLFAGRLGPSLARFQSTENILPLKLTLSETSSKAFHI